MQPEIILEGLKLKMFPLPSRGRRTQTTQRNRGRQASHSRLLRPLCFQYLESRWLLATITWSGAGDGSSWTGGANWNGGIVPGPNDTALINSQSQTIDLSGNVTVGRVVSGVPLDITSGSLTVQAGSSQANNGLTLSSGTTLTVNGAGATLNATGTTVIDGASIFAQNGAGVTLLGVSTYNNEGNSPTLQASGAGSSLSLANLSSLVVANQWGSSLAVNALAGGSVNLSSLAQIDTSSTNLESDGAGSVLNLSSLTTFTQSSGSGSLQITNHGTVNDPLLTTLSAVSVTLDGTGTVALGQITGIVNGAINLSGGAPSFSQLNNINGSSVNVTGGTLSLPLVTAFNNDGQQVTLEANNTVGGGSSLSLANLSSLVVANQWGSSLAVNALAGGSVNLSSLAQIDTSSTNLESDGAGSVLNLSSLTTFTQSSGSGSLQITNHGTVNDPLLTTLSAVSVTLDGTGTVALGQITGLVNGAINLRGGTPSFSQLSDINGSSVNVIGGTLSLPLVSAFNNDGELVTLQANGSGSNLSLASLSSLVVANQWASNFVVKALAGGSVNLSALAQIDTSTTNLESDGAGSVLNLSSLTTFTQSSGSGSLQITNHGTVNDPLLTTLSAVSVTLDGTGTVALGQITGIVNGAINLSGGAPSFSQLNNINGSSVNVTGGTLSLPLVTAFNNDGQQVTLEANNTVGGGSSLSLANLSSLVVANQWGSSLAVNALAGGSVNLSSFAQIDTSSTNLESDGAGSVLNLSSLTTFTQSSGSGSLQITNHGTVNDPLLTTLSAVSVTLDGTGTVALGQITGLVNGAINLRGGTPSFSQLSDINGSSVNVIGGTLSLPLVSAFNNDGELVTLQANGSGSNLSLASLSSLVVANQWASNFVVKALAGGSVNLSALAQIDTSTTNLESDGAGSVLNLSSLTTFTQTGGSTGSLQVTNRGTVEDAELTLLSNVNLSGDATGTLTVPATQSYVATSGTISIQVGTLTDQGSVTAQDNTTVSIPGNVTVNQDGVLSTTARGTIQISGDLLGNTQNADGFSPLGALLLNSSSSNAGSPQLLEAMSYDLGAVGAGFDDNFAYGTLGLSSGTYVELVDQVQNSIGSNPDAVYANSVVVPSSATLNLNGLHLYAYSATINGTVLNGSIQIAPTGSNTATQLVVTGEPPASVTAGSGFALTVAVEDASNNVVTNYTGSVTVALANNPGGSTLGGSFILLTTNGVAKFAGLTMNKVGSGYTLAVSSGTHTPGSTSAVSVSPGPLAQLGIFAQPPSGVTAGSPFGLTAIGEDLEGNEVSGFNGEITVALLNDPGGSSLAGTLTVQASNGVASFANLSLNKIGTGYTLQLSSPDLSSATTASFAVTPGVATQLVISTQPPTTVGASNPFAFAVIAEDALGNEANYSGQVTVALANNPTNSTLSGTLTLAASGGLAAFSTLTLNNIGSGYTLRATSIGLSAAMTVPINVQIGSLTVTGTDGGLSDDVQVTFMDGTGFMVDVDGTETSYSTSNDNKFVYTGATGAFSKFVFDDPMNAYTVTQSLSSTQLVSSNGFELDLNSVSNLYVYGNNNSTATVNVPSGSGSNFFVDAVNAGYSYIADPVKGTYSELSGFGSVTVSSSGGNTYAYIYSTSNATIAGGPGQTTFTVGGVTSTLSNFQQVYVVGAKDGTDSVTLNAAGGTFVGTPQFSYVEGTASGSNFFVGALYAANVTAQAAGSSDKAVFYSYPHNAFTGAPSSSSLSGSTTNVAGSTVTFVSQALGFNSVSVFESGGGTDTADLTSPGHGSLFGTSPADTLTVGSSTITVNTYFVSSGQIVALPSQIVVTGNHDGTDSATIYDAQGNNALTSSGSTATLTTSLGSLTINKFGSVTANKENGTNDTVHQSAIDFALQTVGNWTSD